MNYKLGDFVRFVDENLEGYITRIIDKDTIGVTDANDFEIPVLSSKVTLVHGDLTKVEDIVNRSTVIVTPAEFIKEGVFLGIIADQHSNSVVHFHIVNETSFQLLSSLTTEKNDSFRGEFASIIAPNSTKKIFSAQLGDIQIWPKFRLEILFHTQINTAPKEPIIYRQNIKGKDLSVAKQEIPILKQKGWLIKLDAPENENLIDIEKLRASF